MKYIIQYTRKVVNNDADGLEFDEVNVLHTILVEAKDVKNARRLAKELRPFVGDEVPVLSDYELDQEVSVEDVLSIEVIPLDKYLGQLEKATKSLQAAKAD